MLKRFNTVFASEEGGDNPTGGTGATGDQPPSGLPSDNQPPAEGGVSFEIKPEDLKDGKFQGKWSNPNEMADYIKNLEDKHADLNRKIADEGKQTDAEIQQTAKQLQAQQLQHDTIRELAPAFIENGMQLTDGMKQTLMDTGLTEMEIKVGAYELKEALDKNASYVGGQENYNIIMDFHAEKMTPEEKKQFNHSLQDPNNHQALMVGLQSIYEKAQLENPDTPPQDRVRGNSPANTNSIKPYETKAELMKDKKYADSRVASQADKERFRQRLGITPDKVWSS